MGRDWQNWANSRLFLEKVRNAFGPEEAELVRRAHDFATEKLQGQRHPLYNVAGLLLDQKADAVTLAAALLAPTIWHAGIPLPEIKEAFGETVASTLAEFGSPAALRTDTEPHRRKDIHVLLASFTGNPRKVVLRLAFRLMELEHVSEPTKESGRNLARETLDLYVPLADRLGLSMLRKQLEEKSFRIFYPDTYRDLKQQVAPIQSEDDRCLKILMDGVKRLLEKNGIEGEVQGRTKSLYGIYSKMTRYGASLQDIMDRIGLRIIVSSVPECYSVLGLLHSHFRPIPGTFDDYIGLPKENGYQSLHTCVYPVRDISHKPIEFQIRTVLMHMEAEYGVAAHWRYKSAEAAAANNHKQSRWIESLVDQHRNAPDSDGFMELLYRQVYHDRLVIFGNGGQILRLPENATVQDFVERANPEVSPPFVIRVNGEIAHMGRVLRDGDTVEIVGGNDPAIGVQPSEKAALTLFRAEKLESPGGK